GIFWKAGAVAAEPDSAGAAQHAFIAGKPAEAETGGDLQRFVGNRAFGRPHSRRGLAEEAFVATARAEELLACVLRKAEGRLRQGRVRIGDASNIRVADQRKNGVIEWCCRKLDLPALRRQAVFGKN